MATNKRTTLSFAAKAIFYYDFNTSLIPSETLINKLFIEARYRLKKRPKKTKNTLSKRYKYALRVLLILYRILDRACTVENVYCKHILITQHGMAALCYPPSKNRVSTVSDRINGKRILDGSSSNKNRGGAFINKLFIVAYTGTLNPYKSAFYPYLHPYIPVTFTF